MMQVDDAVYYNMMIEYAYLRWKYSIQLLEQLKRARVFSYTDYDQVGFYIEACNIVTKYEQTLQAQRLKDANLT